MGYNSGGILGDGSSVARNLPVQVASGVVRAYAISDTSFYLKTDGSLWRMGTTHVAEATGVTAFAGGRGHFLYLNAAGEMWVSGDDSSGQLGLGRGVQWSSPVRLAEDVASAVVGDLFLLFLRRDGTIWGAGEPQNWPLGRSPLQLDTGGRGVTGAAAGVGYQSQALAVHADGAVRSLGYNAAGALGAGADTTKTAPFTLLAAGGAAVTSGANHALILRTDGTLWATGENASGQLGNGTTAGASPGDTGTDATAAALSWDDTAQWVLGRPAPLWPLLLEGSLVERARELVAADFTAVVGEVTALLGAALEVGGPGGSVGVL
jgi:alpha-tubulin suppressor-like RCC1 family protein